jgi:hypothetical protein
MEIAQVRRYQYQRSLSKHHLHNMCVCADSPFISWTHERSVAEIHAGTDGIVLEADVGPPEQRLHWSPDIWNEREVLVEGRVQNAKIIHQQDSACSQSQQQQQQQQQQQHQQKE